MPLLKVDIVGHFDHFRILQELYVIPGRSIEMRQLAVLMLLKHQLRLLLDHVQLLLLLHRVEWLLAVEMWIKSLLLHHLRLLLSWPLTKLRLFLLVLLLLRIPER